MKTVLQICGIIAVLAGVVLSVIFGIDEDHIVTIVGLAVTVGATFTKTATAADNPWEVYLTDSIVFVGALVATIGGMTKVTIVTIVGSAVAILAVIVPLIIAAIKKSTSSTSTS